MPDRLLAIGVVATLVAVTLLSLKSRFLNQRLVALARQFRLHHLLALVAGAGMIAHTLLAFWRDWPDSLDIYFTLTDFPTLAGWVALLCFAVAIASSWLPRLSWKRWYLLHLLSLPAFVLLGFHALIFARTRPIDSAILIALFVLLGLAILRALSDRLSGVNSLKFHVIKNRPVADGVFELHLELAPGKLRPEFAAGSIVYLRFTGGAFSRQWHPFSVASCRFESNLRLIIKGIGTDTMHLDDLHEADTVLIRGPFREFTPDFSREQVWIAGGIGIAPFAGYAACLAHQAGTHVTVFHFCERKSQQLNLQNYAGQWSGTLKQINELSPPHAPPDLTQLVEFVRGKNAAQFIVCGPPPFMRYIRHALRHAGIDGANIETEEFLPW